MLTLRLTDNNYHSAPLYLYDEKSTPIDFPNLPDSEKSAVRKALSEISDIPLSKLAEKAHIICSKRQTSEKNTLRVEAPLRVNYRKATTMLDSGGGIYYSENCRWFRHAQPH